MKWIDIVALPKTPKCYYLPIELLRARYEKKVHNWNDISQCNNIQAWQLLDFERELLFRILNCFKSNNLDAVIKLEQIICLYPDIKGFITLIGVSNDYEKLDYHFNLPIKSKKKDINNIFIHYHNKLLEEILFLKNKFQNLSLIQREACYEKMAEIIETHTNMILECMLYHRPDIYTKQFKIFKRKFFNKSVLEMSPFNQIKSMCE